LPSQGLGHRQVARWLLGSTLGLGVLGACTAGPGQLPVPSPTAVPSSTVVPASTGVTAGQCRATLQAFLTAWQREGLPPASVRFLTPAMLAGSTPQQIALRSATITSFTPQSDKPGGYQAELDLGFSGDPGAWGQGPNTRFVTCVTTPDGIRLDLATSP